MIVEAKPQQAADDSVVVYQVEDGQVVRFGPCHECRN